jgi:hypothetical protein
VITGKGCVHHEDVADKLVIRVEIRQIVEHDERVEKRDSCKEQQLCNARDHFAVSLVGTEAGSPGFRLAWSLERFNENSADQLSGSRRTQAIPGSQAEPKR